MSERRKNEWDLLYAAKEGNCVALVELLEKNVDIDCKDADFGYTPLHKACRYGKYDTASILVSHGANLNPKDDYNGRTPLHWASFFGYLPIVKLLIANGADTEIMANDGETAKDYAKNANRPDCLSFLEAVEKGELDITAE
eukprot:m.21166 g.21166  ORF g.21166 m.21166 type:complete len:141 (+) comp5329_c0_seq5:27-449(+)